MDDSVITTAILLFWGGVGAGLLLGGLAGWLGGFAWGIGIGCLVVGAGGLSGAGYLGWHQWENLAGTIEAKGVLIDYLEEELRDSQGRRTTTYAPRVRFRDAAGDVHEARGLGGSRRFEPGDAIAIRYRPERPEQALIADFQNLWGGTWGLSLFGVLPTLFGTFWTMNAITERREAAAAEAARSRPPSRRARREAEIARVAKLGSTRSRSPGVGKLVRGLTILGNVVFVSAFAAMLIMPGPVERAMAAGFGTITAACVVHLVARVIVGGSWQAPFVFVIVGTGFGMFAWGLWMLA